MSLSYGSSLFSSTLTLAVLLLTILSLILAQWPRRVFSGDPVLTTVAVLLLLLITGVTVIISKQPQDPSPLYFKVGDLGSSLVVQWLGLCVFTALGAGSIPRQGTKIPTSHMTCPPPKVGYYMSPDCPP